MKNLWYAVMADRDDMDWGTGSFDKDEAFQMLVDREYEYIAVIDGDECIEEIEKEEVEEYFKDREYEEVKKSVNIARVKNIRSISSLSQQNFCKAYNIPRRTLEDWETGKAVAPDYVLELLERAVRADYNKGIVYKVTVSNGSEEWDQIYTWNLAEAFRKAEMCRIDEDETVWIFGYKVESSDASAETSCFNAIDGLIDLPFVDYELDMTKFAR